MCDVYVGECCARGDQSIRKVYFLGYMIFEIGSLSGRRNSLIQLDFLATKPQGSVCLSVSTSPVVSVKVSFAKHLDQMPCGRKGSLTVTHHGRGGK